MKQTIEIDVPEGWEIVGYRRPQHDEFYLKDGEIVKAYLNCLTYSAIIVKRSWEWPEWLKADWIAMDESGKWFAYSCAEPVLDDKVWARGEADVCIVLNSNMIDFNPPPCDDWKKSLRKNPRLS